MERRTFLTTCGIASSTVCAGVPAATARTSKREKFPVEAQKEAKKAIREGNPEIAKEIHDKYGAYYEHSRKNVEISDQSSEGELTTHDKIKKSGTFDLWARKEFEEDGSHNDKHLFNLYWNWDVDDMTGDTHPYDAVAISWSESAYRPVAGTDRWDSELDNDGEWRIRDDVHNHGFKVEYPLVLDRANTDANGFIEIVTQLRDDIENETTLYYEYIHTWERLPFSPDVVFSLPGPASLSLDTDSLRIGEWPKPADEEMNYDPH